MPVLDRLLSTAIRVATPARSDGAAAVDGAEPASVADEQEAAVVADEPEAAPASASGEARRARKIALRDADSMLDPPAPDLPQPRGEAYDRLPDERLKQLLAEPDGLPKIFAAAIEGAKREKRPVDLDAFEGAYAQSQSIPGSIINLELLIALWKRQALVVSTSMNLPVNTLMTIVHALRLELRAGLRLILLVAAHDILLELPLLCSLVTQVNDECLFDAITLLPVNPPSHGGTAHAKEQKGVALGGREGGASARVFFTI